MFIVNTEKDTQYHTFNEKNKKKQRENDTKYKYIMKSVYKKYLRNKCKRKQYLLVFFFFSFFCLKY